MNEITTYQAHAVAPLSSRDLIERSNLVKEITRKVMKQDIHYGVIPGTKKPTLYQPGAQVLNVTFRIAPTFHTTDLSTHDCARYQVRCVGAHQETGIVLSEGIGTCSSLEEKYKWRRADDREWNSTGEDRRRMKYGKDWDQKQVRTEAADLDNTVLKMAAKRALVAMTINATACSDMFTQDIEDGGGVIDDEDRPRKPARGSKPATVAPQPKAADGNGAINAAKVSHIQGLLDKAGLSAAALCEALGVDSLPALPQARFVEALTWIEQAAATGADARAP